MENVIFSHFFYWRGLPSPLDPPLVSAHRADFATNPSEFIIQFICKFSHLLYFFRNFATHAPSSRFYGFVYASSCWSAHPVYSGEECQSHAFGSRYKRTRGEGVTSIFYILVTGQQSWQRRHDFSIRERKIKQKNGIKKSKEWSDRVSTVGA